MGKVFDGISPALREWIAAQHMFFVATAPLAADGLINCSPKGLDCLRIIGPRDVAYLDLTGSGAETIAHLRENGRLVIMFSAFDGPPRIVRLHGQGHVATADTAEYELLRPQFPDLPGARAIIRLAVRRVSDSCGFAVPRYDFREDRDTLTRWAESKGRGGLETYRQEKNRVSLDGLPALEPATGS